jgi:hypothetical protein
VSKQQPFIFQVSAVGDGTPEAVRVRRLLKALGRVYGLRVEWPTEAVEAPAVQQDSTLVNEMPRGRTAGSEAGSEAPRGNVARMASG